MFFAKELINEISKYYWDAFEALNFITTKELNIIVSCFDTQDFWNECFKLLVDKSYVDVNSLLYLKSDYVSLMNLYKLHGMNYITQQMINVQIFVNKNLSKLLDL